MNINKILASFQEKDIYYLAPGKLFVSKTPKLVKTVLGSCISIIFHYSPYKLTAISHAQLPDNFSFLDTCSEKCPVYCNNYTLDSGNFKYVSCSFMYMFHYFKKLGIPASKIEVQLYGGSKSLKNIPQNSSQISIGEKNINKALELIEKYNLKLIKKDIQSKIGHSLILFTETAEVFITHLEFIK